MASNVSVALGELQNMNLHGKVALITGASRGIGKAIAERLGRDGASIVVNYYANRQGDDERARAEEVAQVIEKSGGAAVVAEANVADAKQLRGLFDLAEKHFGGLDILVANAAAWRFAPIAEVTDEDFDLIFNTCTRHVHSDAPGRQPVTRRWPGGGDQRRVGPHAPSWNRDLRGEQGCHQSSGPGAGPRTRVPADHRQQRSARRRQYRCDERAA